MPINFAALPVPSFEIPPHDDPQNVFLPKGTLLVAKDGTSYRAREYDGPVLGDKGQIYFPEKQSYSVSRIDGMSSIRDQFTRKEVMDLGLVVVWYPEEGKEF